MTTLFQGYPLKVGMKLWHFGTVGTVTEISLRAVKMRFPNGRRQNFDFDGRNPDTNSVELFWQNPVIAIPPPPEETGYAPEQLRKWKFAEQRFFEGLSIAEEWL